MALFIESLPHNSEDLSFDPQKPGRRMDMGDVVVMQTPVMGEAEAGGSLEAHGPL